MTLRAAILVLPILLLARAALAQTCTASTTAMTFSAYDHSAGSPNDTTATVTVQCSTLLIWTFNYSIQLSTGVGGSFSGRHMANGAAHLTYQIYKDAARSQSWGDGTGGTSTVTDSFSLFVLGNSNRSYTAYGRIPTSQSVTVGAYADIVTVLVSY